MIFQIATKFLWLGALLGDLLFWVVCIGSFSFPISYAAFMALAGSLLLFSAVCAVALVIKLRRARWAQIKLEGQLTDVAGQQGIFWLGTLGLLLLLYVLAIFHYLAFGFRASILAPHF